jgi:type IV pilus assembly protein PilO
MNISSASVFTQITFPKAILISLLIGGLYYANFYDDGSRLEQEIATKKVEIKEEEEKKIETDRVKAKEKEIFEEVGRSAEKYKEVTARFPVNLKSDEIISMVNVLAKSTNVRVISVKKEEVVAKELYEEVPVRLELSGTFNNLVVLMYNIATLERITNLGDFDFSNSQGEYNGNIKLITTVIGYKYRKPPDPPPESENDKKDKKKKGKKGRSKPNKKSSGASE